MVVTEWNAACTRRSLREPTAADDKYSRGVVGMRTGSEAYPGAALLGVEAAWRTGTGMVRYIGPPRPTAFVLSRRPETVTSSGRVQAWVIGSGTDAASRSALETSALVRILSGTVPVVVDAGALDLAADATAPVIVTPHAREFDRLRAVLGLPALRPDADDAERTDAARDTATALGGVVLLKGSATLVADPGGDVRIVRAGTPWLATAGTGDVLGGVLGAVIAGGVARDESGDPGRWLADAVASASWLHGRAGNAAAERLGGSGGPITALDVAEALPGVVGALLASASD
ncbi:ADP/ATP-dependent (S)-NAD(P)H-hydrate dehydratase [Microbacterium sp. cx-59]|uniref:ADP-dependent NAD(P)H-hydrate dehydratase n=1 Tax=Microbacterium sp. cx-59 TaxID=2891207 RepID=UPI001E487444|nr:ADP/ATP-dependent (S)-NAD(P)H-hydrate dehydratase [Microbacterium sp. cx-59]MCC4909608.1 NAD(P)H-hydrate dehydratase [Microbacterium sp. cx-59]